MGQYQLLCVHSPPSQHPSLCSFANAQLHTADFAIEIAGSLKFFIDYARGKPGTHGPRVQITDSQTGKTYPKMDFGEAFGVYPRPYDRSGYPMSAPSGAATSARSGSRSGSIGIGAGAGMSARSGMAGVGAGGRGEFGGGTGVQRRESYDENVRLAPYSYEGGNASSGRVGAMRPSGDSGSSDSSPGRYYGGPVVR